MKTKYNIVKEYIQEKIKDGTYQPNKKISSESELMEHFGVSRHTVRLAIGNLVTEGWLYSVQGSGTFCKGEPAAEKAASVKKIAIVTTYISDYIFPSIIRGAEMYLSDHGYNVSIFSTNNNHEQEKVILEKVINQGFDGVIIEPTKSAMANPNIRYYLNMENLHIPYVMIHASYDELNPISVTIDDEKGGFIQTEHLINLGHTDIMGFFKTDDTQGVKRMRGYLNAHRKHNLAINPEYVVTYNTDEKVTKPTKELQRLLETNKKLSSVVCYNDELAMHLLDILRNKKIKVPEEFSMISYDDSFLATVSEIKLTSIIHPKSEMGKKTAQTIIDMIEEDGEQDEISSTVFPPDMTVRDSASKKK